MRKLFTLAACIVFSISFSGAFAAESTTPKTLAQIHGASWPNNPDGFVTKNQCMQCHGDYAQLAQKTAKIEPNPHLSHLGKVNCEECHKANQVKPELMCNQCHNFTLKTK